MNVNLTFYMKFKNQNNGKHKIDFRDYSFCYSFLVFCNSTLLCNPSWPGPNYVDHTALELRDLSAGFQGMDHHTDLD